MHAEATPEPPATVIVRRTWSWSRLGTVQEWGVVLRGHDGKRHVVTADSPGTGDMSAPDRGVGREA